MLQTYIYLDQWDHYLVVSLILQNMQLASIALNRNAVGLLPRRFPTRRITGLVQISVATKTRSLMPPVSRHCNHFLMTPDIQLIKRPNPSSPLSCHPSRFTSASESQPRAMIFADLNLTHLQHTRLPILNPLIMVPDASRRFFSPLRLFMLKMAYPI